MANTSAAPIDLVAVSDLVGRWRRQVRCDATGHRDLTTRATRLQGPSAYVDLRRPPGRPSFAGIRSIRDLSFEQVRWLAGQQAYAGRLTCQNGRFVWTRALDLHSTRGFPDAGMLELSGNLLIETGVRQPYVEHWAYQPVGPGPVWSRTLLNPATRERAQLLRVGSGFAWARDGRPPLPTGVSLADLVNGVPSLWTAQDLVDFEVSFGEVVGAAWVVTDSSLPYREGRPLSVDLSSWTVTHAERGVISE